MIRPTSAGSKPEVRARKAPPRSAVNRDGVSTEKAPWTTRVRVYEMMQAARARVIDTYSKRAASKTRPGYGRRQAPGRISSSSPGTKTILPESPFAPCIVITRTRGGRTPVAGTGRPSRVNTACSGPCCSSVSAHRRSRSSPNVIPAGSAFANARQPWASAGARASERAEEMSAKCWSTVLTRRDARKFCRFT